MSISKGDIVRFRDNYGNRCWAVLGRGKRRADLRALGLPDSLVISTEIRNLKLVKAYHRPKEEK